MKTFLSIKQKNKESLEVDFMMLTKHSRFMFIRSCINMLRRHNFNGVSLDFDFDGTRARTRVRRKRFSRLVKVGGSELNSAYIPVPMLCLNASLESI